MRVLTVCLGNICRSPTAAAALREAAGAAGIAIEVDSAGTSGYHVGDPPDRRMVAAAREDGLEVTGRGRRVSGEDLDRFDLVLAMDRDNLADLRRLAGDAPHRADIRLFRDFTDTPGSDVPDPYYGGPDGFREVVAIARAGARGVVAAMEQRRW
jgi:protein-tyrosine phosphatase